MDTSQVNGKLWFDHATKNLGSELPSVKDRRALEKSGRKMAEHGARFALACFCVNYGRVVGEFTFAYSWIEDKRDGKPITVSGRNAVQMNWLHVAITYPC